MNMVEPPGAGTRSRRIHRIAGACGECYFCFWLA